MSGVLGRHLGALCTKRVGGWQHYCLPPVLTPSHSPHPHAHPGPWSVVSLPVPGVCVGWLGSSSPLVPLSSPPKLLAAWVLVVVGATAPYCCAPGEPLASGPFIGQGHGELTGWWANQFGTPNFAAHGGFCSVNMAAAGMYTIGGSFWEFGEIDWEHTKYLMLFGKLPSRILKSLF